VDIHVITRICSAISALFSDPSFELSVAGFRQLLLGQRWIVALFAASAFRNADHILGAPNIKGADPKTLPTGNLAKFCLLYVPNSGIPLDIIEGFWDHDRNLGL
jgi:hypothetical protein